VLLQEGKLIPTLRKLNPNFRSWPILFRASSTSVVKSFRNTKLVPHPHANVLSSDGFARGFIRSGTDYSVYNTPGPRKGMDGLDLAFYKGRSKYHTKYDAVSSTLGGQRSLWSMMETARGVGVNLLNAPLNAEKDETVPVYFDRKFANNLFTHFIAG
jgi:hypothetical protein